MPPEYSQIGLLPTSAKPSSPNNVFAAAKVVLRVEVSQQAILLKDCCPSAVGAEKAAAVRLIQAEKDAQQRRFACAGSAKYPRDANACREGKVVQHDVIAVSFAEVLHPDFRHFAPTFSVNLSTASRKRFSNSAEMHTITAVQAKRSGVSK